MKKLEKLVDLHQEDCPEFLIPMFVFKEKVRSMPSNMDEHDDIFMGMRYFDDYDNTFNFQLYVIKINTGPFITLA